MEKMHQPSIEAFIKDYFARVLDVQPETIDIEYEMDQYGLSSAVVVSLIGELESMLSLELSPALIFEYPTIAEISEKLAEMYSEQVTAGA